MPSTDSPKRAILYARVSTEEQAEEGYSLPEQVRDLTASFIVAAPGCGSCSERRTPSRLWHSRLPTLDPSPR